VDNDDEINSKESSNRKFIAVGCVIGNRVSVREATVHF